MDSLQLYKAAKSDKATKDYGFLGVFSPDTIPITSVTTSPCTFISNTQNSNQDGEHWVALHIDDCKRGWFFDSFGAPPKLDEFIAVLDHCQDWTYNRVCLQSLFSTACGQYCLFFIAHTARGFSMDHRVNLLDQDDDKLVNDAIVNSFVKHNFSIDDLHVIDFPFVFHKCQRFLKVNLESLLCHSLLFYQITHTHDLIGMSSSAVI